jgi:hypothetical protein
VAWEQRTYAHILNPQPPKQLPPKSLTQQQQSQQQPPGTPSNRCSGSGARDGAALWNHLSSFVRKVALPSDPTGAAAADGEGGEADKGQEDAALRRIK